MVMGFFDRLKKGLSKTRKALVEKVEEVILRKKKIDEEMYEELEEALIQADIGVNTAMELVAKVRNRAKEANTDDAAMLSVFFKEELEKILNIAASSVLASFARFLTFATSSIAVFTPISA